MTSTHLAMDYNSLNTAAEILDAFKQCQNAGEEIQLFESLAERENPPVDAFVEILRKIKLETVLALAIQAFGKITNDEVNARLKGSEDLLAMLCEQAKSGATDLIRWSAATTIEKVGFSFIDVSQYLTEEPTVIIQRIVQSKVNKLYTGHDDYDSSIRFWVYGATYQLRAVTANIDGIDNFARRHRDEQSAYVVNAVVKAQDVWGIRNINLLLIELLQDCKSDFFNFIFAGQSTSENILRERTNNVLKPSEFRVLISNQIFCVGSQYSTIRKCAVDFLCSYKYLSIPGKESDIEEAINTIRDVTSRIKKIATSEVKLNKSDIDLDDIKNIRKTILNDFESAKTAIKSKEANDLSYYNSSLASKDYAKRDLTAKVAAVSEERVSANFFWLILLSPIAVGIAFLVLYIPVGLFVAIATSNKAPWQLIVWLTSIGCVAYPFVKALNTNIKAENKKSKLRVEIRYCEEEKKPIQEQIKKVQEHSSLEIDKAKKVKKERIAGVEKVEDLLKKRKEVYKMVKKSLN
jgi:hypothetical protein